MNKPVLLLGALLLLPGWPVFAAPAEASPDSLAKITREKAEVQNIIAGLTKKAALGRSASEFIDELSLFDNQLYGRLEYGSNQTRISDLKVEIATRNGALNSILIKTGLAPDDGALIGEKDIPPADTDLGEIQRIQTEVEALNDELGALETGNVLEGGSELLGGQLWTPAEELHQIEGLADPAERSLEYYTTRLKTLAAEEKNLSGGTGEKATESAPRK